MMRKSFILSFGVVAILLAQCESDAGHECTGNRVAGLPIVNICKYGTQNLAAAYLSASSADLGQESKCNCTLKTLSSSSNGSYFALQQTPSISNCSTVITVLGSSQVSYSCQSSVVNSFVYMNASDVIIEVFRNGSVDFGFCVFMDNRDNNIEHKFNLTCETDASYNGATTSTATEPPTLTSTSLSTSSSASSNLSSGVTIPSGFSASPNPTSTTPDSTTMASTFLPTPTASSTPFSSMTLFSFAESDASWSTTPMSIQLSPSTSPSSLTLVSTLGSGSASLSPSPSSSASTLPSISPSPSPSASALLSVSESPSTSASPSPSASPPTAPSTAPLASSIAPSASELASPSASFTSSSEMTTSSGTATATNSVQSTVTEQGTSTFTRNLEEPKDGFSIVPIAAGVAGGLLFLLILGIVIVVVCVRRKRKAQKKALRGKPETNRSYLRFSEVVLEDNILYESSSAFPAGDAPKTGSATQPVEDKTGGSPTSGKTSVQPGRGQYLGPAGDLYSLVQKPREDGGPEDASSAQRHSTAVDAPAADEEEDEEDTASQHDVAANDSLPAECDLAPGSLWSSSLTPEMHFDDVELSLGHGGQTVQGSSDGGSPTTDYTVIDHEATRDLITAL